MCMHVYIYMYTYIHIHIYGSFYNSKFLYGLFKNPLVLVIPLHIPFSSLLLVKLFALVL